MQLRNTFTKKTGEFKLGAKRFVDSLKNRSLRSSHQPQQNTPRKSVEKKPVKKENHGALLLRTGLITAATFSLLSMNPARAEEPINIADPQGPGLLGNPPVKVILDHDGNPKTVSSDPDTLLAAPTYDEIGEASTNLVVDLAKLQERRPGPAEEAILYGNGVSYPTVTGHVPVAREEIYENNLPEPQLTKSFYSDQDLTDSNNTNHDTTSMETIAVGKGVTVEEDFYQNDGVDIIDTTISTLISKYNLKPSYTLSEIRSEILFKAVKNSDKSMRDITRRYLESNFVSEELAEFIASETFNNEKFYGELKLSDVQKISNALLRAGGNKEAVEEFVRSFEIQQLPVEDNVEIASESNPNFLDRLSLVRNLKNPITYGIIASLGVLAFGLRKGDLEDLNLPTMPPVEFVAYEPESYSRNGSNITVNLAPVPPDSTGPSFS